MSSPAVFSLKYPSPLNDANADLEVNFLEYRERRPNGKERRFSQVADLRVDSMERDESRERHGSPPKSDQPARSRHSVRIEKRRSSATRLRSLAPSSGRIWSDHHQPPGMERAAYNWDRDHREQRHCNWLVPARVSRSR